MFLSIYENRSGQNHVLRRIAPNESKTAREYVRDWIEREYGAAGYDARAIFSEPGSHISSGCGDFECEIRDTKEPGGSAWEVEPFFVEIDA